MLSVFAGPLRQPRPALTARYRVLFTPLDARETPPRAADWLYLRDDSQVRISTGDGVERIWHRGDNGLLRFCTAPATSHMLGDPLLTAWAGEPGTADWQALTSLIGSGDLQLLEADTAPQRRPACIGYTLRAAGLVDLLWDAARQLPLRMTRLLPTGTLSHTLLSTETAC